MRHADDLPGAMFDFVGHVARAADVEELQRRYLDGVGRFVPASAAGLYVLSPFTGGTEAIAARGVSDFFLCRYEECGRHEDPVLARAVATRGAADNAQLMPPDAWTALPVYDRVFRLHRMRNLLEAPLVLDDAVHGTLNFGRSDDEGAFGPADRARADALARLVSVALASVRARVALRRERDGVVAALELCADAVVVTDLRAAERRVNAAARRLLDRLPDGDARLDDLLLRAVRGGGETTRQELEVALADGAPALLVGRTTQPGDDRTVLVTFLELAGGPAVARPRLPVHRLTPREEQVARLAAGGLHDPEIAAQLHLSPYTVKQYLKAAYGKLGIRSRVELARLAD